MSDYSKAYVNGSYVVETGVKTFDGLEPGVSLTRHIPLKHTYLPGAQYELGFKNVSLADLPHVKGDEVHSAFVNATMHPDNNKLTANIVLSRAGPRFTMVEIAYSVQGPTKP